MWFFHETSVLLNLEKHLPAAKDFIKKYLEIPHASNVKYSLRSDYQAIELRNRYLEWEKRQRTNKTFSSIVMSHLERKGMRPSAFYHKAGIDRKLFSKMKTDFCYQPNKLQLFAAVSRCNSAKVNRMIYWRVLVFRFLHPVLLTLQSFTVSRTEYMIYMQSIHF